jgi:hypothetical protein
MDWDDDACSTTSSETTESAAMSPSSSRRNSARKSIVPALWHAEHARLLSIQATVLESERAVRSRELKFESEVARIKTDLARLKQARTEQAQAARLSWLAANSNNNSNNIATTATTSTSSDSAITTPTGNKRTSGSGQSTVNATASVARVSGPRGPRPRPQQQQPTSTSSSTSKSDATPQGASAIKMDAMEEVVEKARPESQLLPMSLDFDPTPPSLPKFSFESALPEQEDDPVLTESLLSSHLTEARSARAQERHKRKIEAERIRELSMLLTLGSEVRKWEERLAWSQVRSRGTCSDDMSIIESGGQKAEDSMDMDTDPDPRFKRLSRSFSVPSRGSFVGPSPSAASTSPAQFGDKKKAPLPLPSLASSPLWRVSAEMILRRGSRSERPRRPPSVAPPATTTTTAPVASTSAVTPAAPSSSSSTTLTRPSHVLRGPRELRSTGSASSSTSPSSTSPSDSTSSPATSSSSDNGSSSVAVPSSATSSSGKRYSIPPPITIPSNSQFRNPTANMPATVSGEGAAGAAAETEPVRGFQKGERPAHPQSAQTYSTNQNNGSGFFYSRSTTPIKPSTLKWAFTADDLARELELEKKKDGDVVMHSPTSSTSSSSESDDSYRSSSEGGVSSSSMQNAAAAPQPVERRGRARFSWRRSIPKDSNNAKEEIPAVPPVHIGA